MFPHGVKQSINQSIMRTIIVMDTTLPHVPTRVTIGLLCNPSALLRYKISFFLLYSLARL